MTAGTREWPEGCACRPGRAAGARAPLSSPRARPAAAAQRATCWWGREMWGEAPGTRSGTSGERLLHLSRRVRAKLGAEERAGFESAGGGLLGGPEGGGEYK